MSYCHKCGEPYLTGRFYRCPISGKLMDVSDICVYGDGSLIKRYFDLGWRITPLEGKKPFLQGWQNSRLTFREFAEAYRPGNNVGVITGWLKPGELALIALDVDEPILAGFNPEPWLEAGAMAHTTSNALRIIFYTDDNVLAGFSKKVEVKPEDLRTEDLAKVVKGRGKQSIIILEVLAEGRQFMAPPSKHPETGKRLEWVVGPKPPGETLIIHSFDEFKRLMEESVGAKWVLEELFESSRVRAEEEGYASLLSAWLEEIKKHLNIAGEGPNYIYVHCPFHPPDREPSFALHKHKFYAVDYHDGRVYSLKELAQALNIKLPGLGIEARGEEEKPKKKVIRAAFVELPDGRLAEEAYDGKQAFFLVYNPQTDGVERLESIELEDCIYKPIESPELEHRTVLLPSDIEEYGSEEQLLNDLLEYMNRWHEPPNILSRLLDAYYVIFTYAKDLVPQLPYLRCLAPWGRGKSTWLDVVGSVCYRPIILAGSDTDKSIVRRLSLWRGTALIDEADFGDTSLYAFIIKILNIGFDRRKGWYYRSDENNPKAVIGYYVYGPKLLATRSKFKDVALESRCLTFVGRENVKPVPLFRMERFLEETQRLRNKLILWRFRNYHKIKELAAQLEEPGIAEKLYDGADRVSSRVKQIILPLWLIMGDRMKEQLANLAKTIDAQLKAADEDYLLEVEAREAAISLVKEGKGGEDGVNVVNVFNVLYRERGAYETYYSIKVSTLSRELLKQRGLSEDEITVKEVTSISKRLAKIFETRLGFRIVIGKGRTRRVLIPAEWIEVGARDLTDFFEEEGSNPNMYKNVHEGEHGERFERPIARTPQNKEDEERERGGFAIEHSKHSPNSPTMSKNVHEIKEEEGRGGSPNKNVQNVHYVHPLCTKMYMAEKPGRVLWVCGDCAKESGRFIVLERFGRCELCGREAELGRLPAEAGVKPKIEAKPEEPKEYPCPRCKCIFFSEADLSAHLRGVHGVEE
ncbi:MAG: bifunctional DNA primase/polymerase [Candidatus Bathyarchaeia archaeon]